MLFPHPHYCDLAGCKTSRNLLEGWFALRRHLLDRKFIQEFSRRTPEKANELFFANRLSECNLQLARPAGAGRRAAPDWQVDNGSSVFYVEATCPGIGTGRDMVTESTTYQPEANEATNACDHDQIRRAVLRLSHSVREKARSRQAKRALDEQKPFIVAISMCGINVPIDSGAIDGATEESLEVRESSLLLRFLYGLGETGRAWVGGPQPISVEIDRCDQFPKNEGDPVSAGVFLPDRDPNGEYSSISAVLFSPWSYFRHQDESIYRLCLCHNANASYPLEKGLIPGAVEYWIETSESRVRILTADTELTIGAREL